MRCVPRSPPPTSPAGSSSTSPLPHVEVVERLHSRDTTLTAADEDETAQPTHFAAPSRGAAVAIEGSCRSDQRSEDKLHLDQATATEPHATLLRTTPNGTEGMRRKTSLRLHGTGPVALD